ncbi:MAG: hypothetical protein HY074_04265 [Deltaproteobacteria bacterium]|nr:hypothetical protein [Deltaproteobacteria bacterium]
MDIVALLIRCPIAKCDPARLDNDGFNDLARKPLEHSAVGTAPGLLELDQIAFNDLPLIFHGRNFFQLGTNLVKPGFGPNFARPKFFELLPQKIIKSGSARIGAKPKSPLNLFLNLGQLTKPKL